MTESSLTRAQEKRSSLFGSTSSTTNAFRLIDGEGDQLPGIILDCLDTVWLVSTRDRSLPRLFTTPRPGVTALYWKRLDQDQKEAPQWIWGEKREAPFLVIENGVHFELSLQAGYSQGIFLDQRENRSRLRHRARPGDRVLNTFSYTCAFSVVAALSQAVTTSLDLSNTYLTWGKRNFQANGIDPSSQYFCKGDALTWMHRFAKQGRRFHGIILDPPTFSRSREGTFSVRKDYHRLVAAAAAIIEPEGWLLATSNDRGLTHARFESLVRQGVIKGRRQITKLTPTSMPPDFTGEPYLKSLWVDLRG